MRPAILVGRRTGDPWRDKLWEFCRARWIRQHPIWPIAVGYHEEEGPFSLALASNRAAMPANNYDVYVYVGADWIAATAEQVTDACELALARGQLVFAHDCTIVLTETSTRTLLDQVAAYPDDEQATLEVLLAHGGEAHPNTFSGVVAVPRSLWEEVGGFDERFIGWGFDDLAFWRACTTLAGGYERIPGVIAHLWHPTDWETREGSAEHGRNMVLYERYVEAQRQGETAMRALLAETP